MTWILIAVVALLIVLIVAEFNSLIRKRNRAKNAWADIEVQLKRRHDLIPNIVETVKGYAAHEKIVFQEVTDARTRAFIAGERGDVKELEKAEQSLTTALKTLFAVAENYPQLRASENFQKLQEELSSLENDIQSARRYYNAAVRELNNAVQIFPANIVAGIFGFKQAEFFGAEESEKGAVKVSF
jgi:LemA protein